MRFFRQNNGGLVVGYPPSEIEQRIADELGVDLCEHCGIPRLLHAGFNHASGRCMVDLTGQFMLFSRGTTAPEERADAIAKIKEWDERASRALEVERFMGSGI
jgi:hypothetical protein